MATEEAGFFKTLQALNIASSKLLSIGKTYALQFKNQQIDSKKYEEIMVGKLYEITSSAVNEVNGSEEINKFLKKHLADALVEPLKQGIEMYTQAIDTAQKTIATTQPKTVKEALDLGTLESSKIIDTTNDTDVIEVCKAIRNTLKSIG